MTKIKILIPVFNCEQDLIKTMNSILYNGKLADSIEIIIVDFGSVDNTYNAALDYCRTNIGVYQLNFMVDRKQRIAEMAKLLSNTLTNAGESDFFTMVLYPGELLAKDFFKVIGQRIDSIGPCKPDMIIVEADLNNGKECVSQNSIYDNDTIIDMSEHWKDYLMADCNHQVFCLLHGLPFLWNNIHCAIANEQRYFIKLLYWAKSKPVVLYVKESLGVIKNVKYDDEADEVIACWENMLSFFRLSAEDFPITDTEKRAAFENLAAYAMKRSEVLRNNGETYQAEKCEELAEIIGGE